MSWNFTVKAPNVALLKKAVMDDKNVSEWKYCPEQFARGMCAAIDGMPEPLVGNEIQVTSHGHVHDGGGAAGVSNASFEITYVRVPV